MINQEIQDKSVLSLVSNTWNWMFVNEELKSRMVSFISYFSWVLDIFLAILFVAGLTHVPAHSIVFEPKYWYEVPLFASFTWCITVTGYQILLFYYGMGLPNIKNFRIFFVIYLFQVVFFFLTYTTYYYIWVIVYEFYPPLPFNVPICPQLTATITSVLLVGLSWLRYVKMKSRYQLLSIFIVYEHICNCKMLKRVEHESAPGMKICFG